MTNNTQVLFDRAVAHVRRQGKPAMHCGYHCLLLTEDGLQCAVGGLIDKDLITEDLEDNPYPRSDNPSIRYAIQASNPDLDLPVDDPDAECWWVLSELQAAHDRASAHENFIDTFNERVEEIRDRYNLE